MSTRNYGLISSIEELRVHIERVIANGGPIGFDIETGYLGPDREKGAVHPETALLAGISFTDSTDWARYAPLGHDDAENLDNYQAARLFWMLLSTGRGVAHNAAFELRHLSKWFRTHLSDDPDYGTAVRDNFGYFPIRSDTLVEAYLAAEFQSFGLKVLTLLMFDRRGRAVDKKLYRSRVAQLAAIKDKYKDDEPGRKTAMAQFDGHQMTELYDLFTDLAKNKRKYLRFNVLPLDAHVVEYACEDSVWCLAIHEHYFDSISTMMLYSVEKAIVEKVVPKMEDAGVLYNWALMRQTADKLRIFRDKFNAEIMNRLSELAGEPIAISLASPPAISSVLYDKLGYRTSVYTDKTRDLPPEQRKMSTGKIALERLAQEHPVVQRIREWKQITRLLGTYLDKYEGLYNYADDGRAHPNHMSAFVITGRFAVNDPPYQQSPKKYHYDLQAAREAHAAGEDPPPGTCFKFNFRDCIIAPPEHYGLGFDLSQAELRAIAGEANETALLEAFANGDDVHRLTASLMLGIALAIVTDEQRGVGKTMNFALLYGMGVKSLADRLGIPIEEAQSLMDKYFAGMSNIAAYMTKQVNHGKTYGYVTSKFGRKLPIWEYLSDKRWIYQKGDRACVNYPIQGAATGDYMKIAMVRAVGAIKQAGLSDKIQLVMNIHDALEFYVHNSVDPQQAVAILRPAVVFEVPGWPAMQADWHLFSRWGSPTDIIVNDDGTLSAKGGHVEELVPEVVEDEDGDAVEVLPEVDPAVLIEAARRLHGDGRQVIVTVKEMPTQQIWKAFVDLNSKLPGSNSIKIITPLGEVNLPYATGLRPDHLGLVNQLFPGASVQYAADRVEELAAGLTL